MNRLILALALSLIAAVSHANNIPVLTRHVLSPVYTIDKKYRSMEGPGSLEQVYLGDRKSPELLWLVGVKTEMVGADGKTPQLAELMCHVNLDYEAGTHRSLFALRRSVGSRVVTLSQGVLAVRLPDGFGYPVASNEPLTLFTQVLNHNIPNPMNLKVRHRVTFEYIRERDVPGKIKPLINIGASGTVFLDKDPNGIPQKVDVGTAHGQSCLMAPKAPNAATSGSEYVDPRGQKVTGHWVVPPGRQINQSDVTWFMALPFDAKLHYAAVHLHPFAESLSLRDVTAKKTIFTARAANPKDRVGLDHVDRFVNREGVPLYRNHQYELISVYNNTTEENHDSMASVFLGVEDREFVRPSGEELIARAADYELSMADMATIQTSIGPVFVRLLRGLSPKTAEHFARLMKAGQWKGARVASVEGITHPLSVTLRVPSSVGKLALETTAPHEGGSVSICPSDTADGEFTFSIALQRLPERDGRCTLFGQVMGSVLVLRQITSAPRDGDGKLLEPVKITGAELAAAGQAGAAPSM
jgi:cyclophilin family peptidyl-prolyl cis-trans isomerase